MIVAMDANALVDWCKARPGSDNYARLAHLLATIGAKRGRLILPTPVLAEFFVRLDSAAASWIQALEKSRAVVVHPFDRRSAWECGLLHARDRSNGGKRVGAKDAYQKIKVDRQIVAICRVAGARSIITRDATLQTYARLSGVEALTVEELPLPDAARQQTLPDIEPKESGATRLSGPSRAQDSDGLSSQG